MAKRLDTSAPRRRLAVAALVWGIVQALAGCEGRESDSAGAGPGHRSQVLALEPEQELALGREAYREILAKADPLPPEHPAVQLVRRVGGRIVAATRIQPLLQEINLHEDGYRFEWEFNVIESDRINAFCLPAGKVAVYTGLLQFVRDDDELATVLGHEMAHALAHHASERLALNPSDGEALRASGGRLATLDEPRRRSVLSLLGAGSALESLAYNRFQETEADHIGVFLMTFAGYDPEQSLAFWERMRDASVGAIRLPEILSDHPADARRLAQLRVWVPLARGAKRAYDTGQIESAAPPEPAIGGRAGVSFRPKMSFTAGLLGASRTTALSSTGEGFAMSMGVGGPIGGGGWYQPRGPYGAYPGCGCSSLLMIIAGILLVMAGMMRGCNM